MQLREMMHLFIRYVYELSTVACRGSPLETNAMRISWQLAIVWPVFVFRKSVCLRFELPTATLLY